MIKLCRFESCLPDKSITTIDEDELNYNKLLSFISFYSFDESLEKLAHKHGLGISFVQPAYTSQMCPVCGHIHENNCKSQEHFKCECCGYEANADENSSVNIKDRVSKDVLRNRLLKLSDNGEYRPKQLNGRISRIFCCLS